MAAIISASTYGMCHCSGVSTTPSSEMNSATMILRMTFLRRSRRVPPTCPTTTQRTGPRRIDTAAEVSSRSFRGWLDGPVRYLMTTNGGGPAPDKQLHEDMGRLVAEMIEKGIVVATGGLDPKGTHVSAS